jgi:hypothetical protein
MQKQVTEDNTGSFDTQTIDPETTASAIRQQWLERVVAALHPRFHDADYFIPQNIRTSIGFCKHGAGCTSPLGQCWSPKVSTDGFFEIFISPQARDTLPIIGTVAHELTHAVVGLDAGHRRPFKRCANAIGLIGKMRTTTESDEFREWMAEHIISQIGEYPAGAIVLPDTDTKQTTRMLGCKCETCGYLIRTTRMWIEQLGPPLCPEHGLMVVCNSEAKANE